MLGSGLAGTMVVKVIVGSGVRCQEVEQSSAVPAGLWSSVLVGVCVTEHLCTEHLEHGP